MWTFCLQWLNIYFDVIINYQLTDTPKRNKNFYTKTMVRATTANAPRHAIVLPDVPDGDGSNTGGVTGDEPGRRGPASGLEDGASDMVGSRSSSPVSSTLGMVVAPVAMGMVDDDNAAGANVGTSPVTLGVGVDSVSLT